MGGNMFPKTKRIRKSTFDKLTNEILSILTSNNFLKVRPIKSITEKKTFGDIDILISNEYFKTLKPDTFIKQCFGDYVPLGYTSSGISFVYKNVQVDFIFINYSLTDTHSVFYDYNDLGNLIGRLAKFYHCKYKPIGLYFTLYSPNKDKILDDIFLSSNVEEIFDLLGLDYNRYKLGFETYKDAFDFVLASPCFIPKLYVGKGIVDGESYRRGRKRKTYVKFLNYIKHINFSGNERNSVASSLAWLDYKFKDVNLISRVDKKLQDFEEYNKSKTFFNGRLVMDYTGLTGKELGDFMGYLRNNYVKNLESKLYELSEEQIKKDILKFYESYKLE